MDNGNAPASLQAAFAAATSLRACARCRGTGQLPARRKADAVQCPDCARAVVSPAATPDAKKAEQKRRNRVGAQLALWLAGATAGEAIDAYLIRAGLRAGLRKPAKPRIYVRATESDVSEVSEQLACRGYSQRCACARCIARREEYAAYDRELYARAVAQSSADERFARRGLR